RGYVLLSAGHSIAVQNFNENLNILLMLAIYSLLLGTDLGGNVVIWMFGGFVAVMMIGVMLVRARNQRSLHGESLVGIHSRAREAEILPAARLVLVPVAQQVGRVVRDHDRHIDLSRPVAVDPSAQARDAGVGSQERLCRETADHQDQPRTQDLHLAPQVGRA